MTLNLMQNLILIWIFCLENGDVSFILVKSGQVKQINEFKKKLRKLFKSHQVLFEELSNNISNATTASETGNNRVVEFSKSLEQLKLDQTGST